MTEGKVSLYACGITPYSDSHLGHGVAAIRFDTIRRYLEYKGNEVTFVQNVTNVDDKLIAKGNETGESPIAIANRHTAEYRELLEILNVTAPIHEPDVISYIPQIITYIEDLVKSNHAYVTEQGNVYFRIASDQDYGKLSRRKIEANVEGTRVESETDKADPNDFALWKIDTHPELSWDSPWGRGRPGWHIECSVMSNALLGEQIDIHCGGLDLLFPHHENEIAQCEAHNHKPFVNYWVHSGLLTIDGQKMSKSLGNLVTLKDAIARYGSALLKFTILRYHYRSEINLTDGIFEENINAVLKNARAYALLAKHSFDGTQPLDTQIVKEFEAAMDEDANSSEAIVALQKGIDNGLYLYHKGSVQEGLRLISTAQRLATSIGLIDEVITLEAVENQLLSFQAKYCGKAESLTAKDVANLIAARHEAKQGKNYAKADEVRDTLLSNGVTLLDNKGQATQWMFKIS